MTIQDDGSEDDLSYVKLIDYGKKVITNNIRGFLLMQIVKYLSHVHPRPRTVYLSRHGQSLYNVEKKKSGATRALRRPASSTRSGSGKWFLGKCGLLLIIDHL